MTNIFTPSLYAKDTFNPEDFIAKVSSSEFEACVRNGIREGLERMKEFNSEGDMSLRSESNYLHETIFNSVIEHILNCMPDVKLEYSPNKLGSERLYFKYAGYVFIFQKKGAKTNKTKQSGLIDNQAADSHILIIEYALDAFRDQVKSIEIKYRVAGEDIFTHSIAVIVSDHEIAVPDAEPISPRFKVAQSKVDNI